MPLTTVSLLAHSSRHFGLFLSLQIKATMQMKKLLFLAIPVIVLASCQSKSGHDHQHDAAAPDSSNTILYNQVMDIHDEVMPKIDDLEKMKARLNAQLTANPAPAAELKKELEGRIARLDSARQGMFDWMHGFNPPSPSDSVDTEAIRTYLEDQMEKAKMMRENVLEALQVESQKGNN